MIRALWGPGWTRLPFFCQSQEVLPERGHALAPTTTAKLFHGVTASLGLDGADLVVEELAELPLHELLVRF
jgi:hypothetical protein